MQVIISESIQQLPERGDAWLVGPDGEIRAKFHDGNFVRMCPDYAGDECETLKAAA